MCPEGVGPWVGLSRGWLAGGAPAGTWRRWRMSFHDTAVPLVLVLHTRSSDCVGIAAAVCSRCAHWCCHCGDAAASCAQVLLANGATIELQDALGRSALMFAAGNCARDTLLALLDAGAGSPWVRGGGGGRGMRSAGRGGECLTARWFG